MERQGSILTAVHNAIHFTPMVMVRVLADRLIQQRGTSTLAEITFVRQWRA
jgi:hypothetical protein